MLLWKYELVACSPFVLQIVSKTRKSPGK